MNKAEGEAGEEDSGAAADGVVDGAMAGNKYAVITLSFILIITFFFYFAANYVLAHL